MRKKDGLILPQISCQNITFSYGLRDIFVLPEFQVNAGEKILITGPSGSGKSSFLSLLAGLIPPKNGTIEFSFDGLMYDTFSEIFSNFRRKNIAITFSEPLFFDNMSVSENIFFPHTFARLPYNEGWKNTLIEDLKIGHLLDSRMQLLSSGEKDRINIIRALLYNQPFLFLDEPGSHLDSELFGRFISLLGKYLSKVQPTLLLISHRGEFQNIVDTYYICEDGHFTKST